MCQLRSVCQIRSVPDTFCVPDSFVCQLPPLGRLYSTAANLHCKIYYGPQTKTDVVISVSDEYIASIYMV